jgi:hypothetical protein
VIAGARSPSFNSGIAILKCKGTKIDLNGGGKELSLY